MLGQPHDSQRRERGDRDPHQALRQPELPGGSGESAGPGGEDQEGVGHQQRFPAAFAITPDRQGDGAEAGKAGDRQQGAHVGFAHPQSPAGEGETCRRMGLGESLDHADHPHHQRHRPVVGRESFERKQGFEKLQDVCRFMVAGRPGDNGRNPILR